MFSKTEIFILAASSFILIIAHKIIQNIINDELEDIQDKVI